MSLEKKDREKVKELKNQERERERKYIV